MKQQLLVLGLLFSLVSCSTSRPTLSLDEIFSKRFEHKMISSGSNFPDFYTKQDSIDLFLVALHEKVPINDFRKKAGWTKKQLEEHIAFLVSKKWLKKRKILRPTIFVATNTQGKGLYAYSTAIALQISRSIEEEIAGLQKLYRSMDLAKTHNFDELSFFILSNVLLDNWQINNVEHNFLKTEKRPERHGKHYYYAIMENANYPKESFNIYGNQYNSINDSTTVVVYGNNRNEIQEKLKNEEFLQSILDTAPIISKHDSEILEQLANNYKPKLIKILDKNIDYILSVYSASDYDKKIEFEEFFIWWYHFIYTQATNIMAENGLLQLPKDGNFYYLME